MSATVTSEVQEVTIYMGASKLADKIKATGRQQKKSEPSAKK
ncbi:hypothetical protein [Nostoc sp. FACHB-190]|nr:hypothetical protein [Nostoc sp. FACHB-190]